MLRTSRRYQKQSRDELRRMNHPERFAVHDLVHAVIGLIFAAFVLVVLAIAFWQVAVVLVVVAACIYLLHEVSKREADG